MMNSETLSRALIQSDCLYLQAAGSTGDDGSVPGIHLRWDLMGKLENRIPKGTFEDPNIPSDTVEIFRSKYEHRFPVTVDFASQFHRKLLIRRIVLILERLLKMTSVCGYTICKWMATPSFMCVSTTMRDTMR